MCPLLLSLLADWLFTAIDWVVDNVLAVLKLDELVNTFINAILSPLKLDKLTELSDMFDNLVNLQDAQDMYDAADSLLSSVADKLPLDDIKQVSARLPRTGRLHVCCHAHMCGNLLACGSGRSPADTGR
jgi:hypothetical protein